MTLYYSPPLLIIISNIKRFFLLPFVLLVRVLSQKWLAWSNFRWSPLGGVLTGAENVRTGSYACDRKWAPSSLFIVWCALFLIQIACRIWRDLVLHSLQRTLVSCQLITWLFCTVWSASHFWGSTLTESTKLSKVSELLVLKEESLHIYSTTNLMNLYKNNNLTQTLQIMGGCTL